MIILLEDRYAVGSQTALLSDRFAVRPLRCRTHINLTTKISITGMKQQKYGLRPTKILKNQGLFFIQTVL